MKTKDGLKLSYVLLPTEDATPLCIYQNELMWLPTMSKRLNNETYRNQHIYLCSEFKTLEDKCKQGEYKYCSFMNKIDKYDQFANVPGTGWCEDCRKIHFTTDPQLISDGVPAIDGNTKAWIKDNELGSYQVNFLEEFVNRWNEKNKSPREVVMEWWHNLSEQKKTTLSLTNYARSWRGLTGSEIESIYQKDNQKVDVDKFIEDNYWLNDDGEKVIETADVRKLAQALQSQAGGFSLEDMKAMAIQVSDWKDGYVGKSDNRNLDSVVKDFIQSLTKEQPKQDSRIPGGANLRVIKPKDIVIELNDGKLIFK